MKNTLLSKNAFFNAILLTATVFTLASCNDASKANDTKKVAEEHNDAKFNTAEKEKDAQFLVNAAETNLETIQLAQLAQTNSTTTEVKTLAKMLQEEHTKSLNDLTALAKTKLITIPTASTDKAQAAYKSLSGKSKKNFDVEYCKTVIDRHKDAVAAFEKKSMESTDADIKQWATTMLPVLRTHLDQAITCEKNCEKMK